MCFRNVETFPINMKKCSNVFVPETGTSKVHTCKQCNLFVWTSENDIVFMSVNNMQGYTTYLDFNEVFKN